MLVLLGGAEVHLALNTYKEVTCIRTTDVKLCVNQVGPFLTSSQLSLHQVCSLLSLIPSYGSPPGFFSSYSLSLLPHRVFVSIKLFTFVFLQFLGPFHLQL